MFAFSAGAGSQKYYDSALRTNHTLPTCPHEYQAKTMLPTRSEQAYALCMARRRDQIAIQPKKSSTARAI